MSMKKTATDKRKEHIILLKKQLEMGNYKPEMHYKYVSYPALKNMSGLRKKFKEILKRTGYYKSA